MNDPFVFHQALNGSTFSLTRADVDRALPDEHLIALAEAEFARKLSLDGIHGRRHWRRVLENGLILAHFNRVNPQALALFAIFHDCQRHSDGRDPDHGRRAAAYLQQRREIIPLPQADFEGLVRAVELHADPVFSDPDPLVMSCWDADRLNLGRAGILPDPARLCTPPARQLIDWAWSRDQNGSW